MFGDEPDAHIQVRPDTLGSYQVLEVVHNDPDGDGILTDVEDKASTSAGVSDFQLQPSFLLHLEGVTKE